jgi:hypothetical protein
MRKIEAHPDAAIFPMMSKEELANLAEDIKTNGQRFPIVIGKHEDREVIVDGRNRFAACEIAGVEPKFEQLNGHDPKAFILSVNINRRHMTAGQRAMAVAIIYPKPAASRHERRNIPPAGSADDSSLAKARAILRHSRSLADAVLDGTKPLIAAYDEARLAEGKISNETIRLRKLRDTRPDLAERVVQGDLALDAAVGLEKTEAEAEKQRRWAATKNLVEGVQLLDRSPDTVADIASQYDPAVAAQMGETITPERLRRVSQFALVMAEHLRRSEVSA